MISYDLWLSRLLGNYKITTSTKCRTKLSVNKVSAVGLREAKGRLSYKRGGRELKGKARVRTEERERGEDPSTFSFIFIINLFKTILIGLN
jgi:hypothetical protein